MAKPAYVVLARKYRPQGFEELLGQPAASITLKNAIASKKIAHAYLFTGPRGVGKTTMARILSKALNCASGPTAEPCLDCQPCREIAASSCLDVLEMDAASHTSVDNVREAIIETVALAPTRDRYKVFIIDEAHMLSTAAFNALLKTLEEPPPHVVFILATTEAPKVPATIASRCQRFRFRPVPADLLQEHLSALARKEKIEIEAPALELLAKNAEGSLRDGVGLLDQCRSYSEGRITVEAVREMFGLVPRDLLLDIGRSLLVRDPSDLSAALRKAYEEGVEPAQLAKDLRSALEEVYLARSGLAGAASADWEKAAEGLSREALGFLLRRLNDAMGELRSGDSPRLTLELSLFACLESAWDLSAWVQRLERLEKALSSGALAAPAVSSGAPAPGPASGGWADLIAAARAEKPALAGVLEKARLESPAAGPWKAIVSRSFELEQLRRGLPWLEAKMATLFGRALRLAIELGQVGQEATATAPPAEESPFPDGAKGIEEPDAPPAPGAVVDKARRIFGGKIRLIKKPT